MEKYKKNQAIEKLVRSFPSELIRAQLIKVKEWQMEKLAQSQKVLV